MDPRNAERGTQAREEADAKPLPAPGDAGPLGEPTPSDRREREP